MEDLLKRIRTTEERDNLLAELNLLINSIYEDKGAGLDSALRSRVRYWVGEIIREQMPGSIEESEKILKNLKEDLDKLKIFKLKIAFEPNDSTIDKFINYLRSNSEEKMIIDLEIDPKIYGGAEITFEGEFRDFSLKRLFESEYKEKEDDLKKLISKKKDAS